MKGRHFGPRPVPDPLNARFNVRCKQEFLDRLLTAAAAAGLSLSAFVCRELGELPGPRAHRAKPSLDETAYARILAALGRSGNNLNQLLQKVNRYDFCGHPELIEMHRAMKAAHVAHHQLVAAIMAELGVQAR
jgi:hypothetical protein